MPRGYRSIILAALVGLALISFGLGAYYSALNYPKEDRYQSYGNANLSEDRTALGISNLPSPKQNRTPCVNPETETDSDLCAQWRAARAAEKGADWTRLGVFTSICGIAFLIWQIMLTREAVEDTGNATKAMLDANRIAKNSQRPWISIAVEPILMKITAGGCVFKFEVTFTNVGQTVASKFHYDRALIFKDAHSGDIVAHAWENMPIDIPDSKCVIMPKGSFETPIDVSLDQSAVKATKVSTLEGVERKVFLPTLVVWAHYRSDSDPDNWHKSLRGFRLQNVGEAISCESVELGRDELTVVAESGYIAT